MNQAEPFTGEQSAKVCLCFEKCVWDKRRSLIFVLEKLELCYKMSMSIVLSNGYVVGPWFVFRSY